MRKTYEYLLIKKNKDGLFYDRRFFNNSKEAREDFRKNDVLLKCKAKSIYYDNDLNSWTVKVKDIIATYEK